ncbi:hypothetical protein Tco_0564438 [Tanacetum coccineum]
MYTPQLSDSFQENTGYWQQPNPDDSPVEQTAWTTEEENLQLVKVGFVSGKHVRGKVGERWLLGEEILYARWQDKAKNKGSKASGSSTMNDDALARLMVTELTAAEVAQSKKFMELKRREVECREREIAAAEYRALTAGKSLADPTHSEEDDSEIPPLEDIYQNSTRMKFDFANVKTASTPIETQKPLVKDKEASDVDVHLYRVTPKIPHLSAVREFLGKSTKAGCQFPWQEDLNFLAVQKQTIVATSTTEQIMLAAASCSWAKTHSWMLFKIHTDDNVADLLTKAFDVSSLTWSPTRRSLKGYGGVSDIIELSSTRFSQQGNPALKDQINKLKMQANLSSQHHKAYLNRISLKQRVTRNELLKET